MWLANMFEIAFVVFLILGILFSLLLSNTSFQLIALFIFGIISSTTHKFNRAGLNFPYIFLILGFLLGYMLIAGLKFIIFFIFLLGILSGQIIKYLISRYVEDKK